MRSDDVQILLPLSQLRSLMTAAESVPALSARLSQLRDEVTALRGLYVQLLETVSNKK
jgi:hypothetical protein